MDTSLRIDTHKHFSGADRARIISLVHHSADVIRANQTPSGAYLASPNFPVYRYSWFRDGAFIADAMSRLGDTTSADAFHRWCSDVIVHRREQINSLLRRRATNEPIPPEDFLPCRYTVDGDDATDDWWEFQLDGYGTWLWALDQHSTRHQLRLAEYEEAATQTVTYVTTFWSEPCYDWWEEHPSHRHTSTLAALHGGLAAARGWDVLPDDVRQRAADTADEIRARILDEGVRDGRLVKWLNGDALDASLVACATPFNVLSAEEPLMVATIGGLEASLAHGGVHRYENDTYFGGGEWPLLSALLGWHYAEAGRIGDACAQLLWVADQADENGDLPEQVSEHLLAPDHFEPWLKQWGPVATPLLWSHAMFITLADQLGFVVDPSGRR